LNPHSPEEEEARRRGEREGRVDAILERIEQRMTDLEDQMRRDREYERRERREMRNDINSLKLAKAYGKGVWSGGTSVALAIGSMAGAAISVMITALLKKVFGPNVI